MEWEGQNTNIHPAHGARRGNGGQTYAPTLCDSHCLMGMRQCTHAMSRWDLGGHDLCTQPHRTLQSAGKHLWGRDGGVAAAPLPSWGLSQLTSTCLAPSWWIWSRGQWTACARVPLATSSALTTSSLVGPREGGVHGPPMFSPSSCILGPARPVAVPGALGGHTPPAPRGPALPARRQTSAVPASHPAPASDLPGAAGGSGWSQP